MGPIIGTLFQLSLGEAIANAPDESSTKDSELCAAERFLAEKKMELEINYLSVMNARCSSLLSLSAGVGALLVSTTFLGSLNWIGSQSHSWQLGLLLLVISVFVCLGISFLAALVTLKPGKTADFYLPDDYVEVNWDKIRSENPRPQVDRQIADIIRHWIRHNRALLDSRYRCLEISVWTLAAAVVLALVFAIVAVVLRAATP